MNYNNSAPLFRNSQEHYRSKGIKLIVADGHIIAGSDGIVARFSDDDAAIKCLTEAGYVREPSEVNIIFSVPELISAGS